MEEAAAGLPSVERLEKAAEVLKAVAHPTRLRIIQLLEGGERNVSDICRCLDIPQAYTSQQLALLKSKGVLCARRDGNQVYYAIENPNVVKIIHCVCTQP